MEVSEKKNISDNLIWHLKKETAKTGNIIG